MAIDNDRVRSQIRFLSIKTKYLILDDVDVLLDLGRLLVLEPKGLVLDNLFLCLSEALLRWHFFLSFG